MGNLDQIIALFDILFKRLDQQGIPYDREYVVFVDEKQKNGRKYTVFAARNKSTTQWALWHDTKEIETYPFK